jgi:lysine 2,3-aminomutase
VLLKGVNDSVAVQRELCRALLRAKVRPYYLFHCDPVIGAGHFRTSVWKGIEIIEGLRGHLSGLGIPTYVVDAPRGGGKIPLMPNYLVSASDDAVVLRNYEGMIIRYHPTGDAPLEPDHATTHGVSALASGQAEVLIPEGNPRLLRRKERLPVIPAQPPLDRPSEPRPPINGPRPRRNGAAAAAAASNGNGKGLSNGNGKALRNGTGGSGNGNGNGKSQGRSQNRSSAKGGPLA